MGSTFVNYRTGCLRKSRDIRERPVPEWYCCMVYNAATRRLIKLNLNAWLIFELCSNRRFAALEKKYIATMTPKISKTLAGRQLDEALHRLLSEGLVEVVPD